MSYKTVPQEFPTRVSHKSVPQECPTRVSYKSVLQECLTECPTRVCDKSVPYEFPARVSYKSVPQECPTRVSRRLSHKRVPQECPSECPTRVSYKSDPQECPTRVSYKSVICSFSNVSAFGFVGSILFAEKDEGSGQTQRRILSRWKRRLPMSEHGSRWRLCVCDGQNWLVRGILAEDEA